MKYPKENCACGRKFGSNVVRQHRRKCIQMLREWFKDDPTRMMSLLDDRTPEQQTAEPVVLEEEA